MHASVVPAQEMERTAQVVVGTLQANLAKKGENAGMDFFKAFPTLSAQRALFQLANARFAEQVALALPANLWLALKCQKIVADAALKKVAQGWC